MLSNPLLVARMIRWASSFLAVVDLFGLSAACDGGISTFSLSLILLGIYAARILRKEESRIIGLGFDGRLFGLFGFWSGFNMPYVTSFCMFPVSAMLLYNLPICSCILSKFEWNFVTARTFFWLHFGYCLSDLISCERYRHSCRWYDGSWLFIFIEYLLKIIRSNLTLLCRVGSQTVFSFY